MYVRIYVLVGAVAEENHETRKVLCGVPVGDMNRATTECRSVMTALTDRVSGVLFVGRHSRMSYV